MAIYDSLTAYLVGSLMVAISTLIILAILSYFVHLTFLTSLLIAFVVGWLINYFVLQKLQIQQRVYKYFTDYQKNIELYLLYKKQKKIEKNKIENIAWRK